MDPQSIESKSPSKSLGSLTLAFLTCAVAAIVLTASAYPIARLVAGSMGIH